MPGSKDVEKRICRMLDMDEKELMAELERSFILSDDCDERIKTSLEEMMQERGVSVDHSSINRWAIRFLPLVENMARKHKRPVGRSWRMDETYIKVKGVWKYLYRSGDK